VATGSAFASAASDAAPAAKAELIASGLENPRGMTFGPDGALYVAEAGLGGPSCRAIPTGEGQRTCFGLTGAITRVARGAQRRVLERLPSRANARDGAAADGPQDVSFDHLGGPYVTVGFGGDPTLRARAPRGGRYAALWRLTAGARERVADLGAFEAAHNPAGGTVFTNPFSVLAVADRQYVTDAGANALLAVDDGRVSLVAAFADRLVDAPPELGLPPGTTIPMEAVPTGLVRGPDGALYVGELTGFPFVQGAARVWRIAPGAAPRVYAAGFTTITDIAFGTNGDLYVLQATANGLAAPPSPGSLIRVRGDGSRITVLDGLTIPTGLALHEGFAYVADNGPIPHAGRVQRIPVSGSHRTP
jgi:hypothetical protein